jgi:steroid 5-alpha reductase family enzyme
MSEISRTGLLTCLGIDLGIQTLGFLHAVAFKTEKLYDFCGSGTFLTMAIYSYVQGTAKGDRALIASSFASIWAVRLGVFLFLRVLMVGKDRRFDEVKEDWKKFGVFWFGQAMWCFTVLLPVLLLNFTETKPVPLKVLDYVGMGMWGLGFLTETIADFQKAYFKWKNPDVSRWIDTGLWSLSRHPNYLGEITLWIGSYLLCWNGLSAAMRGVSVLSPVFITLLLMFGSGIPILERQADARWGNLPEYQAYKRRVSVLIPLPFSCDKEQ